MSRRKWRVCLITPNHISTNPRLVKEAIALETHGYDVHIIFTQSATFESSLDFDLLGQHPSWTYDVLDWSNGNLRSKFFRKVFGLAQKFSFLLLSISKAFFFCSILTNRNFFWQVSKAKAVKANLYIAHNLGALPVAIKAAKKWKAKVGFDAEDFHRFETSDNVLDRSVVIKIMAEEKNLPGIDYFTAASPLIAKAYQKLFPSLKAKVILNTFPQPEILSNKLKENKKIKLFWFSQTVGENRGIEQMVEAIAQLDADSCELHLLGNAQTDFKKKIEKIAEAVGLHSAIFFHPPSPEKEIFSVAATCDIGLASETGVPYNRDICLTNKIFTYVQSGLAVAASNTTAQTEFLNLYPTIGQLYERESAASLASVIRHYQLNRHALETSKSANLQLAREKLNWKHEQIKFIDAVESALIDVA